MKYMVYPLILPATVVLLTLAATPQPAPMSQRYALIIGVADYPNFPEQKQLRFTDDDAQRFYEFIQTPEGGGFKPKNIRLLLNAQATRRQILREIAWVGRRARTNDRVYIFFAGHGMVNDAGRAYFIPYEGSPSEPGIDGIRADDFLNRVMTSIVAKEVVLFVDACYAAAAANQEGTARGEEDNLAASLEAKWKDIDRAPGETFMALFSASAHQRSWEDNDLKQGLFTHYLLAGIRGAANTDKDSYVEAGELLRYLLDTVETRAKDKFKQPQTPMSTPGFNPDFIFSVVQPEPPPPPPPPPPTPVLPPPIVSEREARVFVDDLNRVIREETAKETVNITYADSTDRLASIDVKLNNQGSIAAYVSFVYHPDGYLEIMNSQLAPLEIWRVVYLPNNNLSALTSDKGRQIVFYYSETPDTTTFTDPNTVHVTTTETILTATENPSARQVALVFTLLRKLSGADSKTLFKIVKGKLTPDPAGIQGDIKLSFQ